MTPEAIHEAVGRFRGPIEQIPPMYSAVKVGGVPLYKSARAGKTIARDARTIVIHTLEVEAIQGRDVTLRIVCFKGNLCADALCRHWGSLRCRRPHVGIGAKASGSLDDRSSADG